MSTLRSRAYQKNPFMTFLASYGIKHERGGRSLKNEFAPDRIVMVSGYGPVFKKFGLELDELLPRAIESGYLAPDAEEGDLYGLIQLALSGKRIEPLYTHGAEESIMAQYDARRAMLEEDMGWETEAEYYGMSEDEFLELVAPLTDDELCAIDEDSRFEWDAPASCISTEAEAMRELGFTESEIAAATATPNEKSVTPVSCISVKPAPVCENQENKGAKTAAIETIIAMQPPTQSNTTPPSRALARDGDFDRYPTSCISTKNQGKEDVMKMKIHKTKESSASERYRAALMRMNPEQRRRAQEMAMLIRGMESKNQPTNAQNKSHETTLIAEKEIMTYKHWELHEEMPAGFRFHKNCGSPLSNYAFASNGSPLKFGFKMILVRVFCKLK